MDYHNPMLFNQRFIFLVVPLLPFSSDGLPLRFLDGLRELATRLANESIEQVRGLSCLNHVETEIQRVYFG